MPSEILGAPDSGAMSFTFTQLVFLDFDTGQDANFVYTQAERNAFWPSLLCDDSPASARTSKA